MSHRDPVVNSDSKATRPDKVVSIKLRVLSRIHGLHATHPIKPNNGNCTSTSDDR